MGKAIEVIATERGYYNGIKEAGDRFTIPDESEAGSWMAHTDGSPFTRKQVDGNQQVVVGPDGALTLAPKRDEAAQVLRHAGGEVKPIRDANRQGQETVIGTPTPGFDAKEEAAKADFLARAKEKADAEDDSDEAKSKRKAK